MSVWMHMCVHLDWCSAVKRLVFAVCLNCLYFFLTLFFEAGLPNEYVINSPIQLEWLASQSVLLPPRPQSAHATILLLHEYWGFKLRP